MYLDPPFFSATFSFGVLIEFDKQKGLRISLSGGKCDAKDVMQFKLKFVSNRVRPVGMMRRLGGSVPTTAHRSPCWVQYIRRADPLDRAGGSAPDAPTHARDEKRGSLFFGGIYAP